MDEHFNFNPPPECPVFRPTKEEFKDPLEYIEQIKPIAVKSGICKIIPPDDWRPPFSVNVNTFQFTPRVQKLYELEAQSRIKLNFMTKLSQFVRLQGSDKLKIPNINGRHLDLYKLHKLVHEHGGYDHIVANKLWPKIATKMGYKNSSHVYSLRTHYEKIILPYDIMLDADNESHIYVSSQSTAKPKPVLHPSTTKKRKSVQPDIIDETLLESSNELKRLQFSGAGPRTYVNMKGELKVEEELISGPLKRKCLSDYVCKTCGLGDKEDRLLICDNDECQDCYHCDCLVPPLTQVPKQSWKCHNCVLKVLSKKPMEYGFPSSSITYTLYEFGKSADRFKANYFGKELHELVPCSTVEKEFWRILQSFNDDIIVEYGADIHSSHQGSGFPTLENIKNGRCTRNNGELNMDLATQYSTEFWNLNILPITKKSVLRFIRGNIDGMKVPWCYVGMVFSSFCWHIEDHWSFSINYLHWGEPKTWYGVSSENADQFEAAMRKQAPELFENHEDLLHHITTIMNPNILMKEGVPVYRTDQNAGQFIVTFPRAYHSGFNQGFNFAEAVNFCPANWLPMGRLCVEHYAQLHRHCVFSHDELLCTIAEAALLEQDIEVNNKEISLKYPLMAGLGMTISDICLDTNIRRTVHAELEIIVDEEKQNRKKLENMKVNKSTQICFENMKDDERACGICQTTCFLSGIVCNCVIDEHKVEENHIDENKLKRIVCLRHIDNPCDICPSSEWTFVYRFTLEEMDRLLSGLEVRLQDFHSWEADIKAHCTEGPTAYEITESDRRWSLDQLQMRLKEGAECGFDSCEEFMKARGLMERGQNLTSVCRHWLKAIQHSDDCSKLEENEETKSHVPKSVLIDFLREDGSIEIKNINVACMNEENLAQMNQTLIRFPLRLPCDNFVQMVARLLQWRQDSHSLMTTNMTNPGALLPKVVHLFEEAKRLFPGWSPFTDERTCLMLLGKSLQWLVRIRECEDAVKAGKAAHLNQSEGVLSLPVNLVKESTLIELVNHGETLVSSVKEAATDLSDLGTRFLIPISQSLQPALDVLYEVVAEINRLREDLASLPKRGIGSQILSSLKDATEKCLRMGIRVKEFDDTRIRLYKMSVDMILISKPGRFIDLNHASQLIQLGSSLFSEGVLDRESSTLTQKHLSSRNQITLMTRLVRKLKSAYVGCNTEHPIGENCPNGCLDFDFLKILLPRHFSLDQNINRDRLAHNAVQFMQLWHSAPISDNQIISLMRLYQSMIVDELSSIDGLVGPNNKLDINYISHCCICNQSLNSSDSKYCALCKPRSNRPTINEMAQLNKLLKQCPNIVSMYGIALQALSKRTVTWLESLVALIRLHLKYLSKFYVQIKSSKLVIPVCIKELFSQMGSGSGSLDKKIVEPTRAKDLYFNLTYLRRVGHCLEVNVESYVTILSILISCIKEDMDKSHQNDHKFEEEIIA